jgi:phage protein D
MTSRNPSAAVYLNGVLLQGVLVVDVEANSHLAANRFHIIASLTASGSALWAQPTLQVDIRYSLGDGWVSMLIGEVDRLEIDPIQREVRLDGRDLTARFMSARTEDAFENQTASEVATTLALRRGLLPAVIATTQPVGRSYQNTHTRTTLDQHSASTTEWDLLVHLAQRQSYDVWVNGNTLNFAPLGPSLNFINVTPADCISIQLERSLSLSGAFEVVVKSWDCRGQQAVKQSSTRGSDDSSGNSIPNYVLIRPNLTSAEAQTLADDVVNQMASHGRTIRLEMPADLSTVPRMILNLSNTDTDFDGIYVISDVARRLSFKHGFVQAVQARSPSWITF